MTRLLSRPLATALLLATGLGLSGAAKATLVDRGGGLIYDTVLNITWLGDANYAKTSNYNVYGELTWGEAVTWADQLVYGAYDDWRLPSMSVVAGLPTGAAASVVDCNIAGEPACRDNELGYMFYHNMGAASGSSILDGSNTDNLALFLNLSSRNYWSGTEFPWLGEEPLDAIYVWAFGMDDGGQIRICKVDPGTCYGDGPQLAWPVRNGDVAAAPEPGTLLLFGAGLAGLAAMRRKKTTV
jgi:hypothetical protein